MKILTQLKNDEIGSSFLYALILFGGFVLLFSFGSIRSETANRAHEYLTEFGEGALAAIGIRTNDNKQILEGIIQSIQKYTECTQKNDSNLPDHSQGEAVSPEALDCEFNIKSDSAYQFQVEGVFQGNNLVQTTVTVEGGISFSNYDVLKDVLEHNLDADSISQGYYYNFVTSKYEDRETHFIFRVHRTT